MSIDWERVDRWLMGEASVGSSIPEYIHHLCNVIGVRWAGTPAEQRAADYVDSQFESLALQNRDVESFELKTTNCDAATLNVVSVPQWHLDVRPCMFCPSVNIEAPLVDVGFGMPNALELTEDQLPGAVALINTEFEPFSEPRHLTLRLRDLAAAGVKAAITASPHAGRRLTHVTASDWRDDPTRVPLPLIQTSQEDMYRLRNELSGGTTVALKVDAAFDSVVSWNTVAELPGDEHPDESIVLGAHHDTTPDSFGANDNGAGVAVMLETARLLSALKESCGVTPGRTIRFVSFGGEEQGLQGSAAFVERHYGPESQPNFMMALDELATGSMKGVVLQFPELRPLIQKQLDELNEGLKCHVLTQLDASGDMFPFARRGIPSSFLWRWRFYGRHPEAAYGHSNADTPDKLRFCELKEYAGLLARLLLRLSHVPTGEWPDNHLDVNQIATRIQAERGAVFRTV